MLQRFMTHAVSAVALGMSGTPWTSKIIVDRIEVYILMRHTYVIHSTLWRTGTSSSPVGHCNIVNECSCRNRKILKDGPLGKYHYKGEGIESTRLEACAKENGRPSLIADQIRVTGTSDDSTSHGTS